MLKLITRRRFITISAAAAGLPLIPGSAAASMLGDSLTRWHGTAMGAQAQILLALPDKGQGTKLAFEIEREIARLEGIFSLYRGDSALSRLNHQGSLDNPPAELVGLLERAIHIGALTDGAFDVTVQPLWQLYQEMPGGRKPPAQLLAKVRDLVNFQAISLSNSQIRFEKPGMAVTLNGIAQGYMTDRITALLAEAGIENSLVNMGEFAALGEKAPGRPWQVGIQDPDQPGQMLEKMALASGCALATSGGYGTVNGAANHLLDPKTGLSPARYRSVSVMAPDAVTADALSTGFSVMDEGAINALSAGRHDLDVVLMQNG